MKKVLSGFLCIGLTLSLVGCGKEEKQKEETKKVPVLSCSASEDFTNFTFDFEYNEDKTEVKNVFLDFQMDFKDVEEITEEDLNKAAEEVCDLYKSEAKSCNKEIQGTKIIAKIEMDLDKFEEASKDEDFQFKKSIAMEELKKSLESEEDGLVCKEITK